METKSKKCFGGLAIVMGESEKKKKKKKKKKNFLFGSQSCSSNTRKLFVVLLPIS